MVRGSSPLRCNFIYLPVTDKILISAHTRDSYALLIKNRFGKGYDIASLVYRDRFRKGIAIDPEFSCTNALQLYKEILAITDFSVLPIVGERQEGHTGKFLLKTEDNLEIESVLIPMQSGGTLCVSSQIGCQMGCSFCETGRMGLLRNLTAADIIAQVFTARFTLRFSFRNIVFMGMGEPFDNYEKVMQAFRILTDPHGFGFGPGRITVSTSGCVEGIEKLMQETGPIPNLAVSVNAPDNLLRNRLMPVNRKHDMQALYEVMDRFCKKTGKQIIIAYILLKEVNDSLAHADALAAYLKGLSVKINLIPYNPQSRDRYRPSDPPEKEAFIKRLREHGYFTLLRQTKGQKIMAACGQLGNLRLRTCLKSSIG